MGDFFFFYSINKIHYDLYSKYLKCNIVLLNYFNAKFLSVIFLILCMAIIENILITFHYGKHEIILYIMSSLFIYWIIHSFRLVYMPHNNQMLSKSNIGNPDFSFLRLVSRKAFNIVGIFVCYKYTSIVTVLQFYACNVITHIFQL